MAVLRIPVLALRLRHPPHPRGVQPGRRLLSFLKATAGSRPLQASILSPETPPAVAVNRRLAASSIPPERASRVLFASPEKMPNRLPAIAPPTPARRASQAVAARPRSLAASHSQQSLC